VALKSNAGAIHLLDEAGGAAEEKRLNLAVQQGLPPDLVAQIRSIPSNTGLGGRVIEHQSPLIVPDVASHPDVAEISFTESRQTYVGIPLRARGMVVGILSLLGQAAHSQFNVEEITLLTSIADQIGVVVESARLRQLAEYTAVMEERGRLARELHDSVTQLLYSINLFAKAGKDAYSYGEAKQGDKHLARLGDTASQAIKEMRLLLYELRPPELERAGLLGAIQYRLDAVEGRAGVKTQLLVDPVIELSKAVEEEFYHIVQEALNNSLKHSQAAAVAIRIEADQKRISLVVTDDGSGFDPHDIPNKGGMGLLNMRERAKKLGGELTILSEPGTGTTIQVSLENPNKPNTF
jgi:signal transduction histidine kinase